MTGLTENGRDLQRWERWWQTNSGKNDNDFRNDILASTRGAFDQLRARYQALSNEVYALLKDAYVAAPDAQKKEMVLRYLRNTKPEVREVGARLVFEDKIIDARVIPPEVQEELRKMVGDSATNVRLQVAKTLGALNDPAALQPLLAQLAQETNPDVRAAIATALGPIRDLKAVPPLLNVVNDDSFAVARAGADALKELGPKLRDDNPNLASQTAARLNDVLQKTEGKTGAQELRESLVEAMATLRQHDLIRTFQGLLNQNESVRVRRAALKGLGEIGDPKTADIIVPSLTDQQSAIRLEAVLAMGKVATVENADAIANRVDPQQEPDESVRGEAWKVFQSLLPQMEPPRLQDFADRFSKDPNQRLVILSQLADKQLALHDVDGLALTKENLGQVSAKLNDYKTAAVYYQQALTAHENDTGTVKERLVQNTTDALLKSDQYPEAAKFASDLLKKNNEFQDIIGSSFRTEAENLNKDNHPQSALDVIKQAETIDPPLAPKFQQQLREVEDAARKQLADKSKSPSSDSTPHSAGSVVPNSTAGAAE
jgi:HEAT repeat protein